MKRQSLASCAAATLIAASTVVLPATSAHAASCYGGSCLGMDPQAEGCASDATTIAQTSDPGGTLVIQVRYSSACSAYWARSLIYPPSEHYQNEAILGGWTCIGHCWAYTQDSGTFDSGTVWSNMIPTGYWVQACTDAWINGQQLCTDVTGSGHGPH